MAKRRATPVTTLLGVKRGIDATNENLISMVVLRWQITLKATRVS